MKSSSNGDQEKWVPLHYKDFDYHRLVGVKATSDHLIQLHENLGFSVCWPKFSSGTDNWKFRSSAEAFLISSPLWFPHQWHWPQLNSLYQKEKEVFVWLFNSYYYYFWDVWFYSCNDNITVWDLSIPLILTSRYLIVCMWVCISVFLPCQLSQCPMNYIDRAALFLTLLSYSQWIHSAFQR